MPEIDFLKIYFIMLVFIIVHWYNMYVKILMLYCESFTVPTVHTCRFAFCIISLDSCCINFGLHNARWYFSQIFILRSVVGTVQSVQNGVNTITNILKKTYKQPKFYFTLNK